MSVNSIQDIWGAVLDVLGPQLTPTAMATWFSDCTPIEINGTEFVVHTTSDFKRNIIVGRFKDTIKAALSDIFSTEFELVVLAGEELDDYRERRVENDPLPEIAGYTFDEFIVGNSNRFAHNAAVAVAEKPGQAYNPLFIYGNSGLGKTHLLLAIGHDFMDKNPGANIIYIKGDEFTNQMLKSIRDGTAEEFRTKYRSADLFLVDDIQFISGKDATQEEFFHTFNNIFESNHQIVITSDRPPKDMPLLDDRLLSRFQSGLLADIQPPDLETRTVITRKKAARLGLMLDDDAVNYIAVHITTNVRQIEGVINRLTAYKEILDSVIDTESVKRAIEDVINTGTFIPTPEDIIKETARYYSLSTVDICGQNRSKNTAMARQISMYLIRTLTNYSLNDIGALYEGRNHSTVISSIRKIEELIKTDKMTAAIIRDISSNVNTNIMNNANKGK